MNDNDNPPHLEEIIPTKVSTPPAAKDDLKKTQSESPLPKQDTNSTETKKMKEPSPRLNHSMDKEKIGFRRNSAIYPSLKKKLILQNAKDVNKKEYTNSTKEAIEASQTIKDLKWRIELALNDKINSLAKELNEKREQIEKKKEEIINEAKISEKKKKNLHLQIAKEEKQNYKQEQSKNIELKNKKENLSKQIKEIEDKRNDLKSKLQNKFKEMMELKQTLKNSVDEMDRIKKDILNRKFALNDNSIIFDEQSESESNIKMDSEESLLPNSVNEFKGEVLSNITSEKQLINISAPMNRGSNSTLKRNFSLNNNS